MRSLNPAVGVGLAIAVAAIGAVTRAQVARSPSTQAATSSAPGTFEKDLRDGEAALTTRQYLTALDAFTRANALRNKTSPEAWLGMSRAAYGQQVFPEALKSADQALKVMPRGSRIEPAIRYERALALVGLIGVADDPHAREAEQEFTTAARLDPVLARPSYERGMALLNAYRDKDGVRELTRYVSDGGDVSQIATARRLIANPGTARERFAAPDFALTAANGEKFSLASLQNKVVLLDFWGSWCGPCLANTPGLVALHQKYANQIVTIGIGVAEENLDMWRAWIANHQMNWPQSREEEDGPVGTAFGVDGVPTYIVVDREGRIRARLDGWEDEGPVALEAAITRAMAVPEAK